jgi:flagellin
MLSINTNVTSINAQRSLGVTQMKLSENYGRLSSGNRINRASDDAAGLAISERFKSQIRSYAQAERNAMDAISLLQTAEGAMNEITGVLTRIRELAIQGANGTLGSIERGYLDQEKTALIAEIDRIAQVTEFNGQTLLNGGGLGVVFEFQVGIDGTINDRIAVSVSDMTTATLGGGGLSAITLSTQTGSRAALTNLDLAIDAVSTARAALGVSQNRMVVTIANLGSTRENVVAANSRIRDVDVAEASADMTKYNILMQSGVSVLAQANQMPQYALKLLG